MMDFAIVGCGNIARTHALALRALGARETAGARARVAATCDVVPSRARKLADEFGGEPRAWDDVLADTTIDAVTICTPSGTHASLGVQAVEAGKHVVVEKPMDVTVEAATRLRDAARMNGRTLTVISQHRFDRATQQALRVVAEIGTPVLVDAHVPWWRPQEYYDAGAWRGTWASDGGGALMNQGIHTVDLMLALAGPVRRVQAIAATRAHAIEVEDVVCAALLFESGAVGTLAASTAVAPGFPARLAVHGAEGSVVLEGDRVVVNARRGELATRVDEPSAHALTVASVGTRGLDPDTLGTEVEEWGVAHRRQLADFVDAVEHGRAPVVTAESGIAALEVVTAVYRSTSTGQGVELSMSG